MGDAREDLTYAAMAAFMMAVSFCTGQMYLAVSMAFFLGSLLTFALADYRDELRRRCGLLNDGALHDSVD